MSKSLTPLNIQAIKNPEGNTLAEKISLLEEQKSKVRELFSKLDLALAKEKITLQEYNYLLQNYAAGNQEHKLMQAIDKQISKLKFERDDYRIKAQSKNNSMIAVIVSMMAIIMLVMAGTSLFNMNSGITGFSTYVDKVVKQTEQLTISNNTTINFNATNITSLKLTGSIKGLGTAKAYLLLGDEKLLITSQSNVLEEQTSLLKTDKSIYLTGEEINVSIEGAILESNSDYLNETLNETNSTNETSTNLNTNSSLVTYTLYAKSSEKTQTLTSNNFTLEPGKYELYALVDAQGLTTKESTFIEVVDSMENISKEFTAVCDSTCILDATKIPKGLQFELKDAQLVIDEIIYTTKAENTPPTQIREFNNISLTKGMSTTLDLNEYFTDPDGQELLFDYSSELQGLTIKNNLLTISPSITGIYEVTIYASDLNEMVESNVFTINVIPTTPNLIENETNTNNTIITNSTITNSSNEEMNSTNSTNSINLTNLTNQTTKINIIDATINITNNSINTNLTNTTVSELEKLGLCDDPDVNNRPASCLIENSDYYFVEEGKYLENLDKKKVARITPIGNLLITGDLYEHSEMNPGSRDFKLGYVDDNFKFVTTLYIDSETGDLHLAGNLHEEIINLELPSNVYSFQNKRGVNLGYAVTSTGDIYIRGNLIPYRRSLE